VAFELDLKASGIQPDGSLSELWDAWEGAGAVMAKGWRIPCSSASLRRLQQRPAAAVIGTG
jgi:hypothetical protein